MYLAAALEGQLLFEQNHFNSVLPKLIKRRDKYWFVKEQLTALLKGAAGRCARTYVAE